MTTRNDLHRPGAIIPANYRIVMSYNLATSQDGWPVPSFGVNCQLDRRVHNRDENGKIISTINGEHNTDGMCCIIGMSSIAKVKFAATGGTGKCSVCGVHFVYGDVWVHEPTGEHIHIGHTCADKYDLLADRSEYELQLGRIKNAAAVECQRAKNAEERTAFLAQTDGLEEALKCSHYIVQDIAQKFKEFRSLSPKQVALVMKLAAEAKLPPAEKEKNVSAPRADKRVTFTGTIVSAKSQDSYYGTQYRMTVKVSTPEGCWLAWGTIPAAMMEDAMFGPDSSLQNLRGAEVEVTAKLQAGRDAHFAMTKRPVGKVVKYRAEIEAYLASAKKEKEAQEVQALQA